MGVLNTFEQWRMQSESSLDKSLQFQSAVNGFPGTWAEAGGLQKVMAVTDQG